MIHRPIRHYLNYGVQRFAFDLETISLFNKMAAVCGVYDN